MRKLTLIVALLLSSGALFAQKGKVMSATSFFTQGKLDKAKELIDEAITHEKCVNWAKAYLVRGQIYQAIYEQDSVLREKLNMGESLPLVWESYKKALELDDKDKLAKDIQAQTANLVIDFTNEGVMNYNAKEYKKALDNFKTVLEINASPVGSQKVDTAVIFNAAVSAHNCNEFDQAAEFYKKAISLNYEAGRSYAMLANILLKERDAAYNTGDSTKGREIQEEAVKYLLEGNERFPNDVYPRLQLMLKDVNSLINHADFSFQRLDYIQDSALGLINIEQNEIVKIFSIAAVIFLPATLIASIYGMIEKAMPGRLQNVYCASPGGGKYMAVLQFKKLSASDEGRQRQAALLAFSAFSELKHVFLVDEDVDCFDMNDVLWAMNTRFQGDTDIITIPGVRCHPLDPSNDPSCSPSIRDHGIACKTIFDCTVPYDQKERFVRARFMEVKPEKWIKDGK